MRKQITWWLRGGAHTTAVLDDHAAAIRDLQQRVAELSDALARIEPVASRSAAQIDGLPTELRAAVDDLSDRIGALHDRLERGGT